MGYVLSYTGFRLNANLIYYLLWGFYRLVILGSGISRGFLGQTGEQQKFQADISEQSKLLKPPYAFSTVAISLVEAADHVAELPPVT